MANMKQNGVWLKTQTFGVEIEMGKISRKRACELVAQYFETKYGLPCIETINYEGGHYDVWTCKGKPAQNGRPRKWKFMSDGSSSGDWGRISCEMVTPIMRYDDIEDLQEIVRILRADGARSGAHWNAGVHIHIGADFDTADGQNAKSIRNLVNLISSHERLLCEAVSVTPSRQANWARFVEPTFLREINEQKPTTKEQLERLWYGHTGHHEHYDGTRYHLLNLHAIWDKGTIEFRCFEFHNNLHAGELKAWVQLCLAVCSYAKHAKYITPRTLDCANPKFSMKNWLINMGLQGDEFKTCRKMLTKHLSGDTAYRTPRTDADDAGTYTSVYLN